MRKFFLKLFKYSIRQVLRLRFVPRLTVFKRVNNIIVSFLTPSIVEVQGKRMFLDSIDSLELAKNGVYEAFATDLSKKLIKRNGIVIDIGANIGYYSLIFANVVGEKGKVYAFEPDSTNYALLVKNVCTNRLTNVITEQRAVADENGRIRLYHCLINKGMHRIFRSENDWDSTEIEAIRLDDYFQSGSRKINFIKIDIEGAEPAALSGMEQVLNASPDVKILTEFHPLALRESGFEPREYLDILEKHGFRFYVIDEENRSLRFAKSDELLISYNYENELTTNLLCDREHLAGTL